MANNLIESALKSLTLLLGIRNNNAELGGVLNCGNVELRLPRPRPLLYKAINGLGPQTINRELILHVIDGFVAFLP